MKRILIIEDDEALRENISEFLCEKGYEVSFASNGITGVQMAISQIPDMILCDIIMPGMSGLELFKAIQQMKITSAIPFIFITAKCEKEDIRTGMQLGADDYITKPFDLNELLSAIKIRLEKNERFRNSYDEKFYALIDNLLIGVFIYINNKFIYVNDAFAKVFGLRVVDFEDMSIDDIALFKNKEQIIENISKINSETQDGIHLQIEAVRKGSQKNISVEVFANLINFKGAPAILGNAVSITEEDNKKPLFSNIIKTEKISRREIEILKLVCMGMSNTEIASSIFRSPRTIEAHRATLLRKTGSKNTAELVLYAIQKKIVIIE